MVNETSRELEIMDNEAQFLKMWGRCVTIFRMLPDNSNLYIGYELKSVNLSSFYLRK